MKDYISCLFNSMKTKSESEKVSEIKTKVVKPSMKTKVQEVKMEDAHSAAAAEILENLKQFKIEFDRKIMKPAMNMEVSHTSNPIKGGDKSNPHIRAIYRLEDAILHLEDQLKLQASDPFRNNQEAAPESAEIEESNRYYQELNPEVNAEDEILHLNGWSYANGEIWDENGTCSISYKADDDTICVYELLDTDGVDQELVGTVSSVEELDTVLTNFAELDEIPTEMKVRFSEYIEQQRPEANEDTIEDSIAEEPEKDLPTTDEPTIIDEWEFLASDPEFNGNATLLYDKNKFVVFIQKDSDKENSQPYYTNTLDANQYSQEFQTADLDSLCKWLEVNELPVPTEEAKLALKGFSSEAKEKQPKLPDGMKLAKDNEEISTLAPEVPKPEIGKIEEPEKIKKK